MRRAAWSASSACRRSPVRPAPGPTPAAVYLRVYATRVTTTSAGAGSDGVTVQLTRSGAWLVSAVLFC